MTTKTYMSSGQSHDQVNSTPRRITIVCANLDGLPIPALEYLVLYLNTLQLDIEYQFLPIDENHPILVHLQPYRVVNMTTFQELVQEFNEELKAETYQRAKAYNLRDRSHGRLVVISLAKLDTNYYELYENEYSAIFLGEWKTAMAPPSLLEFIVTLVMMEGVFALLPSQITEFAHLATRGCIGDFNPILRDVRYKTLQGFICSDCKHLLDGVIGPERTSIWTTLLKKNWFGTMSDPTSPASTVRKLGYDLFLTKGLEPSGWEKIKKNLSEDGIKEMLKLIGGVILAALVVWFGLKKS